MSDELSESGGEQTRTHRSWDSPLVDISFRNAGKGRVELASVHGTGGVVVMSDSRRGDGPNSPSRMVADDVTGGFGDGAALETLVGVGHASIRQTTQAGGRQTTSGDKLTVHFADPGKAVASGKGVSGHASGMQIASATVDGNVVMLQEPAPKPGAAAETSLRATAGKAVYEGAGEWLHLTQNPRITDGGLEVSADKVDVSQASGTSFATWKRQGHVAGRGFSPGPARIRRATASKRAKRRAQRGPDRLRERRWVGMGLRMLSRRRHNCIAILARQHSRARSGCGSRRTPSARQ